MIYHPSKKSYTPNYATPNYAKYSDAPVTAEKSAHISFWFSVGIQLLGGALWVFVIEFTCFSLYPTNTVMEIAFVAGLASYILLMFLLKKYLTDYLDVQAYEESERVCTMSSEEKAAYQQKVIQARRKYAVMNLLGLVIFFAVFSLTVVLLLKL